MASKVVLSFANDKGGTIFVHQFRNNLMKRLGFFDPYDIYLDNVACRLVGGSRFWGPDRRVNDAGKLIAPDMGGGGRAIGVTNESWKIMWDNAMSTANAVILVLTPEYAQSGPCRQELSTIGEKMTEYQKLHLVVLNVGSLADLETLPEALRPPGQRRTKIITLAKESIGRSFWGGEPSALQKTFPMAFDITGKGYKKIIDALGAAGVKSERPRGLLAR
jgi:hypothetical protein